MPSSSDRIEKTLSLRASRERVWRALTDFREFGAWFRVNLEGPFVVGQSVKGRITYPGYEHLVMEVQEFALEDGKDGTQLTMVESGFDKVPAARRAEVFRMNEEGWSEQMRNIERHVAAG